jgi:hypothetical protein
VSEASVSIDRALLGASYTEDVTVPSLGAVVRVRVLSPVEISALDVALDSVRDEPEASSWRVTVSRVLHAACSMLNGSPAFDSTADVLAMPSDIVRALWSAYLRMHDATHRFDRAMADEIDDLTGSEPRWIERVAAKYSAGIVAYYGLRSAREATVAQVLWFFGLVRDRE